jgi:hypothetical protein
MNLFGKSVLVLVATVAFAVLTSGRAEAGHDRWSVSYYGGGYNGPSYGITYRSGGGYIHPDYLRPGRHGYRAYGTYPHPRNYVVRDPWCPTHRLNHVHGRGHYDDGDYYRLEGDYDRGYRHGYRDGRRDERYRYRDRYYR